MPLISIGIAMARGATDERVFLQAVCLHDEPVQITISQSGSPGTEEYTFEPPLVVAPTLVCAQTAARLAGAASSPSRAAPFAGRVSPNGYAVGA